MDSVACISCAPKWDLIAGPPLVGYILNTLFLGILVVQVYYYYLCFPKDKIQYKVLVYSIFIIEIVQSALMGKDVYYNFVTLWASDKSWTTFGTTWFSFSILCGIIATTVQLVFANRLWILTKSRILTSTISFLAVAQGTAAIATGIKMKIVPALLDQSSTFPYRTSWLVLSAANDLLIAIAMTYHLLKSKTGIASTDVMIDRIVFLVVETGTATAVTAMLDIALFLGRNDTTLYGAAGAFLTKLYSNTLLVGLNNRAVARRTKIFQTADSAVVEGSQCGSRESLP
ncbi:unnamed protein product [Somion occarium]|uniref:DUF6534 domain-containing protein n=1 Tax=Somion occarium TaxID=3059160 RepID=A0ABP1E4D0_9APHY